MLVGALAPMPAAASAKASPTQYVLRHPRRERCRAHYSKRLETVTERRHGRRVKVRETFCVRATAKPRASAPSTSGASTPAPSATAAPPGVTATTTTVSASGPAGCPHGGERELEFCAYVVTYATTDAAGQAPPGPGPVLLAGAPPSTATQALAFPSGSTVEVSWFRLSHGSGCEIVLLLAGQKATRELACERRDPRAVLSAAYLAPAAGWQASQSPAVTVR